MTKTMMRRRTASTLLLGLLASCSTPKPKIIGTQIPVLPDTDALAVAPDAPPVSVPPATQLDAWPVTLANAAHAPGNVAGPTTLGDRWAASAGTGGAYSRPLPASPLIADNQAFTLDANSNVSAFSLTDGSRIWHTNTRPKHAAEQPIGGGIAYDSGKIYASTGFGELIALDAGSGKILWRQTLDFLPRNAPAIGAGLVAVVVQNDLLLSFDAATGTPGWRFLGRVGDPAAATVAITGPAAIGDGILVAGFSTGTLAAIDVNSGTPLWEQNLASSYGQASSLDFADVVAAPVIAGGVVYAIGLGNTAMAIDLHSGVKVWSHSAAGNQPFCLAGGFAYLLDNTQTLSAIHADDGLVSWQTQLPLYHKPKKKKQPILWSGPTLVNGQLLVTSDYGDLLAVDAVTGQTGATTKLQGPADMPPIAAAGLLLQLTRNATLTAYG
jgi:outer membrane protein assembly factor BamB